VGSAGRARVARGKRTMKLPTLDKLGGLRFILDEMVSGSFLGSSLSELDVLGMIRRRELLDSTEERLRRAFESHEAARRTILDCRDGGAPYVLFLRSFGSEYDTGVDLHGDTALILHTGVWIPMRKELEVSLLSIELPVLQLHGGADAELPPSAKGSGALVTADNLWSEIARELIAGAAAVIFVISELSEGVIAELDFARGCGLSDRSVVFLLEAPNFPMGLGDWNRQGARKSGRTISTSNEIRNLLSDFPNVSLVGADAEGTGTYLTSILNKLTPAKAGSGPFEAALSAKFSVLDDGYFGSPDYIQVQDAIWWKIREHDKSYFGFIRLHPKAIDGAKLNFEIVDMV